MQYHGSCHCGKTRYTVEGDIQEVMQCNCSMCSRRGYLLWFAPRSALQLETPLENLAYYTFNTHTIKHYFCPTCGCAPLGIGRDQAGNETAAINTRCLEDLDVNSLKVVQYDGRSA